MLQIRHVGQRRTRNVLAISAKCRFLPPKFRLLLAAFDLSFRNSTVFMRVFSMICEQ